MFHIDFFGYPAGSALDVVGKCRERCFKMDWVLDMDIQKFFDIVPWNLIQKAVAHHTDQKWIQLYVERWLAGPASLQRPDNRMVVRDKSTAISPLSAKIFTHYTLDAWMSREYLAVAFERYGDDVVVDLRQRAPCPEHAHGDLGSAGRGRVNTAPGENPPSLLQGQQTTGNA